jgi:NAD(P)H dehydrogenase (quinone)
MANVLIVFHSLWGHIYKMARAVKEGAERIPGTQVRMLQVPETLSEEILGKMAADRKEFSHIPVANPNDLTDADAIIFGCGTRYGGATAQMRAFIDSTGKLWSNGALIGKIGSAFTSTGTQHGGQETTIISLYISLLHHGMIIAGVPYSEARQSARLRAGLRTAPRQYLAWTGQGSLQRMSLR